MSRFKLVILLQIILSVSPLFGQNRQVDSLYNVLNKNRDTEARINIYIDLSRAYCDLDKDSAMAYARKALDLAAVKGSKEQAADAYQALGYVHNIKDEDEKAIGYFKKAATIFEELGKIDKQARVYNYLTASEYFLNHYDRSGEYAHKALTLGKEADDRDVIGTSLFYLGNIAKRMNNYEEAIGYYKQSLEIRQKIGKKDDIASVLNNIGTLYMEKADYKNAISYFSKTLEIRRELDNPRSTGIVLTNLGNASLELGEFDNAIRFYKEALGIFRNIGFETGIAADLTGMATIYENLNQFESALDVYKEILRIREKNDNPWELANTYNNISIIYSRMLEDSLQSIYGRDYYLAIYKKDLKINFEAADQAIKYGLMALQKRRDIDDKPGISNSLANLGNIYTRMGKYQEAHKYLSEWADFPSEYKDDKSDVTASAGLGIIYMIRGDYDKSVAYLNHAYKKAAEMDAKVSMEEVAQSLSVLEERQGNYREALKFYRISNEMGDSVVQAETRRQIHEMQVKYETEAKERENELLKKNQALTEAKLRLRNKALITSVLVLLVFIAMLIQLFRQNNLRRKANEELARKNVLITEQTKEITDSIQYASKIQNALLPPEEYVRRLIPEHFIIYRPRDIVSGDFYWITEKNNKMVVLIADCTGHGVPGAFMSMLGVAFLNEIVSKHAEVSANFILNELRTQVIQSLHQTGREGESQDGMDVTVYVIDKETKELQFAGANNPLLICRDSEIIELKADKMPIGIHTRVDEPFSKKVLQLENGDMLYAFTDGYPDQFGGPQGKKFMIRKFRRLLLEVHNRPVSDQKNILESTLDKWMENTQQVDDILVVGVRV